MRFLALTSIVTDWLACDVVWTPGPTRHHAAVLGSLVTKYQLRET